MEGNYNMLDHHRRAKYFRLIVVVAYVTLTIAALTFLIFGVGS